MTQPRSWRVEPAAARRSDACQELGGFMRYEIQGTKRNRSACSDICPDSARLQPWCARDLGLWDVSQLASDPTNQIQPPAPPPRISTDKRSGRSSHARVKANVRKQQRRADVPQIQPKTNSHPSLDGPHPTRVGRTTSGGQAVDSASDHPHAGGENPRPFSSRNFVEGPSPRGWGEPPSPTPSPTSIRTIPLLGHPSARCGIPGSWLRWSG